MVASVSAVAVVVAVAVVAVVVAVVVVAVVAVVAAVAVVVCQKKLLQQPTNAETDAVIDSDKTKNSFFCRHRHQLTRLRCWWCCYRCCCYCCCCRCCCC